MADNHKPEQRSYNMSRIRSQDTKPEEIVRKYLFLRGLRYRKNDKRYPGKPDAVFPKYKTALFINGCFWHCHEGCPKFAMPKSNLDYWKPKLERNKRRDAQNTAKLKENGWCVVTVWECELKKENKLKSLDRIYNEIVTQ